MTTPAAADSPSTTNTLPTKSSLPLYTTIHGIPIYFGEDWATGIGGGLWSTGKAVAHYAATNHAQHQLQKLVQKRQIGRTYSPLTILELGSGNGLLAACWMALCQSIDCPVHFYVTDTADHLPLIQQTMDANPHLLSSESQVFVREHTWGEFSNDDDSNDEWPTSLDMLLGSDVAYHERLYRPLLASLDYFMPAKKNNHTISTTSGASTVLLLGCTMSDTKPAFFDLLLDTGFRYQLLPHELLPAEMHGTLFGVFIVQRK